MVYVASFFSENLAALQERSFKHQEMNFKTRTLVLLCVLFISYLIPGTISAANTPLPGPDPDPRLPLVIDLVQHEDAPFCDCNLTACADACRTIANPGSVTCSYQKDVQFYVEARDLSSNDTYIFPVLITDATSSRQVHVAVEYCNNNNWSLAEDTDWNNIPVLQVLHNSTVVGTIFFHTNLTMNMSVSQGFQLARMEACELECGHEEGSSELQGNSGSASADSDLRSSTFTDAQKRTVNRGPVNPLVIDLVQHTMNDWPWLDCELDDCADECTTPRPHGGTVVCDYPMTDTFYIEIEFTYDALTETSDITLLPIYVYTNPETGDLEVEVFYYHNELWTLQEASNSTDEYLILTVNWNNYLAGTIGFAANGTLGLHAELGYVLRRKTGCDLLCEEDEEETALLQLSPGGTASTVRSSKHQGMGQIQEQVLTVSPNPVSTQFQLRYPATLSGQSSMLSVYDLNGKMVYQQAVSHDTTGQLDIDSSEWPAGLYIIRLENEEQSLASKLIKQ